MSLTQVNTTAPATAPSRRLTAERAAAVAFVVANFMGAMDTQIVNVALPTLSRDFHSPLASVQWTVISYTLAFAILVPASGWIGDKIGTKRTYLIALAIFTVASMLCGQARNLPELVVARVLQGGSAGMMLPVGMSMLWRAFPPSQRARVARLTTAPILVAPAVAPIVGGILIAQLSWRWAFYVNFPFGIAALIFAVKYLDEHRESPDSTFDLFGLVLGSGGLSLLLYAISEGSLDGWGSPQVLTTAVLAIVALTFFVKVENRRGTNALLRIYLLRDRLFRPTMVVLGLNAGAFLGVLYLTPIFLQQVRGQSALSSGLTTFIEALGVIFGSQTVGRFYKQIGPRRMETVGLLLLALTICSMVLVDTTTNLWYVRIIMFVLGVCANIGLLAANTSQFSAIDRSDLGHGSALSLSFRQSAIAIIIAILSTVVSEVHGSRVNAFHAAFFADAAIAFFAAVIAFSLVHDADAKSTLVTRRVA